MAHLYAEAGFDYNGAPVCSQFTSQLCPHRTFLWHNLPRGTKRNRKSFFIRRQFNGNDVSSCIHIERFSIVRTLTCNNYWFFLNSNVSRSYVFFCSKREQAEEIARRERFRGGDLPSAAIGAHTGQVSGTVVNAAQRGRTSVTVFGEFIDCLDPHFMFLSFLEHGVQYHSRFMTCWRKNRN